MTSGGSGDESLRLEGLEEAGGCLWHGEAAGLGIGGEAGLGEG